MKIAIIGSGNLAWHLAGVLPYPTTVVYRADRPTEGWPCALLPLSEMSRLDWDAVFLAVPDQAIAPVSRELAIRIPLGVPVFHTSGATPLDQITPSFLHRGVLWPIRSLRKGEAISHWRELPLVLQAEGKVAADVLTTISGQLSETISWLNDRQRAQLHLAAVFSNNFVTALYEVAHDLCSRHAVPFDLLLPIIRHTALSQDGTRPALRQTGAAARGDHATMNRHLELLDQPAYRDLYQMISTLILQYRLPEHDPHFRREPYDDFEDQGIL
ncbi:uncharacterized protein DUF2520 [Neolewinella xylanilytica]|uniref:Uncharacterized protein DUF2520 n=1 Tax=Neolewinella xylanilytica TaxID=1514080 RepID=A0A2S6HZT5_9BACT|nr:DUF2520 domain-containing protein [Neolewinella xylanilytica]PPK84040.1 uncharacterized protein DUF2520 [Neolewinella xylanilytica]